MPDMTGALILWSLRSRMLAAAHKGCIAAGEGQEWQQQVWTPQSGNGNTTGDTCAANATTQFTANTSGNTCASIRPVDELGCLISINNSMPQPRPATNEFGCQPVHGRVPAE